MMKLRTLIIAAVASGFVIAAADSGLAVEKKDKKATTATTNKKEPAKGATSQKVTDPKKSKTSEKKFDDFIDQNKNGIDDRRENLVAKKTSGSKPKTEKDTAGGKSVSGKGDAKSEKKTDSTKSKK